MKRVGICTICSKAAILSLCALCGAAVCPDCMKEGVCANCRKGMKSK